MRDHVCAHACEGVCVCLCVCVLLHTNVFVRAFLCLCVCDDYSDDNDTVDKSDNQLISLTFFVDISTYLISPDVLGLDPFYEHHWHCS